MTCRYRSSIAGAALVAFASMLHSAHAADLPPVKSSSNNPVAECATPGRLMAYLRDNNPQLAPKFNSIATEYMRHGEALGLRWDYAFFQMLLETGYLKYTGDVKPDQNNFAGLGATGKGVRGESFKDVSTGVRAHIEHLLMYSGDHVDNPVAERTRNVQEWGVLVPWQKSIGRPITFTQLAKQWAPGSKRYGSDMESIAQRFFNGPCLQPDPEPQLAAELQGAKGGKDKAKVKTASVKPQKDAKAEAKEKAKKAADAAAEEVRKAEAQKASEATAQDAPESASAAVAAPETRSVSDFAPQKAQPPIKIINAEAEAPAAEASAAQAATPEKAPEAQKPQAETAAPPKTETAKSEKTETKPRADQKATKVATVTVPGVGSASSQKTDKGQKSEKADKPEKTEKAEKTEKSDKKAAAAQPGKCRVWTASYGGSKAIIIKAVVDKTTNYTVLDVNEGSERREADAYIDAYAKGGEKVGEFASQPQALEKAFELCPEG